MENINNDVNEQVTEQPNSLLEKQAELEGQYKSACAQEILLIEQLKQVTKQREAIAGQLELVRGLANPTPQ